MSAAQGVEVVRLAAHDVALAVGVLARGMRDNPIHVAALGPDPERRERLLARMFSTLWRVWDQDALCAKRDGEVVGVCGRLPPGRCRLDPLQSLRMTPAMLSGGPRTLARTAITSRRERLSPQLTQAQIDSSDDEDARRRRFVQSSVKWSRRSLWARLFRR